MFDVEEESEITPIVKSDNSYFDIDAAIGFPIWLDRETLDFIFAIRYNSPAFANSYLQESYRIATHSVFSDIIKDLIQTKVEAMKEHPWLYEGSKRKKAFQMDDLSKDNIIHIASSIGIEAGEIDAACVVSEVVESLQNMLVGLIKRRPGMGVEDKKKAITFLDHQLWDEKSQLLWRNVSSAMMAKMFDYDELPRSIKIISYLDKFIRGQFVDGELQAQNVETATFFHLLSDDVLYRVYDELDAHKADHDSTPEEWLIPDAVSMAQELDDDGWA
jgi:hypothetical protein